ncbi:MAG: hypothetical protein ACI9ZT_000145 [Gammaproteobacteria bacterium]|jgi:hypothetical protein
MVLAANDRLNISAQKAIHLGADHVFRAFDYHGSKPRGFLPLYRAEQMNDFKVI